jgi:hypothetical protein
VTDPTVESSPDELVVQYQGDATDPLPGDANGDQVVNFNDFLILSANFGKQTDAVFAEGDFDNDNAVTFGDFLILSANYGRTQPADLPLA